MPTTISCQKSTFGLDSNINLHSSAKRIRSFCVRGDHIAGPLLIFNIRNCIAVLSETIPDPPPKASISRKICPFATPPIAGLQDIWAIVFIFIVTTRVEAPSRSEEHTSELQSRPHLVCRLLLEKKKTNNKHPQYRENTQNHQNNDAIYLTQGSRTRPKHTL